MARHNAAEVPTFVALVQGLGVAGVSGVVVGAIVAGLGSRIAMRISAIAAGPDMLGRLTENGNRVGDITVAGTAGLILFAGVLPGIASAVLYVALRPWLSIFGPWRGGAFGLVGFGLIGWSVIDPQNSDFRRFGPPLLNVALFAVLFPLYGAALAPFADWLSRAVSARAAPLLLIALIRGASVLAAGVLLIAVGAALESIAVRGNAPLVAGFFGTLGLALAGRWLLTRGGRDLLAVDRRAVLASYGVLAAPALVGLVVAVSGIARIIGLA